MLLNLGLLLFCILVLAYILIPPAFMPGSYLDTVRTRYRNVLGGQWNLRKTLIIEAAAVLIVILIVTLLTFLSRRCK
jgi:hypothetical protein